MNEIFELLEQLNEKDRKYLKNYLGNAPKWLLESFQTVEIKKNIAFMHENACADTVYILVEGVVKGTDYRVQGITYDYTRFYPVEVFGAMEFLMGYNGYNTTLTTETNCKFLRVSREQFEKWMVNDIHAVLEQVKTMNIYLLEQVRKERLFLLLQGSERLLLLFMKIYKMQQKDNVCTITFTRKYLSNSTGLSIKTIDRCVKKLENEGYISKNGRKILINEKQYLEIRKTICEKIDEIDL